MTIEDEMYVSVSSVKPISPSIKQSTSSGNSQLMNSLLNSLVMNALVNWDVAYLIFKTLNLIHFFLAVNLINIGIFLF